jgi:LPXTG-motif cell wall-anchored protein
MKTRSYLSLAGALTLGIAMLATPRGQAQPLDDRVIVDMPYTTTVGKKTLQPGKYIIQRLSSQSGGGRVLLFYSDDGQKFETSAMTIPALDPNTARDTKVVLTRVGDDYYYNKIWVQGKQYGYEFPLPRAVRQRQRELMAQVTVPASTSSESTITTTTTTTTAQAEPAPVVTPEPAPVVEPQPEIAQAEPLPEPTPVTPEPEVAEELPSEASREMDQAPAPAELPKTANGWLAMMLGGGGLLGAGLMLRRKQ